MPPASPIKPVIGIIGGIGSGKTTIADELSALGCAVVDADAIGHELLGDPDVLGELRRRWGDEIFTSAGEVDRASLAEIVFTSRDELDALNDILHPRIGREMARAVGLAVADESVGAIVLDAALLLEAGWNELCSHVVFVDTPPVERYRRVSERRGWRKENWEAREKMQISLDIKRSMCDYSVDGSSSVSHLRQQVRKLYSRITHPADGFEHSNKPE
ncbi:MAG: dephospho-CoA kinase [Phycisphaerae bacterium]|jgi:dephospho-CoA kinase|nr:dephospho-CoA kinase [Phycisphaerae bacterium]